MTVLITFQSASMPAKYEGVDNVYTKGGLLCLSFKDSKRILKFPLINVFCIESDYE